MSALTLLHYPQRDETMVDEQHGGESCERVERQGYGRRETDRPPSVWQDPKTWMALFGVLLTGCAILLTFTLWVATRMLDEIKGINSSIHRMELTTSNSFTAQGGEISQLIKQQNIESTFMREQNAYNFNVNKAMTEVVTTLRLKGLPVPTVPEPPKLGGQ